MKMKVKMKKHTLKFISVFMAIFLWIYVLNSEKVKFEKTVSLEYILPSNMMFAVKPVQEVVFMIEGPRAFVKTVAEREDKLIIDLNRQKRRKQTSFSIDIVPTQLNLPFGMVVERVLPRKIQISLEKRASKMVPVKVRFKGQFPDELSLTKLEVIPSEVRIMGPASVIKRMREIQTTQIDKENLIGFNEIPVEPRLVDSRISFEPGTNLRISYKLKATSANLVLKDIPIRFLTQMKTSSPTSSATLKLLAPPGAKDRSNISSSVQIWADIPSNTKGRIEVPLKAIIPPGIHLLEIVPKSIIVNVK
jgi:YbbR domain-containing protein